MEKVIGHGLHQDWSMLQRSFQSMATKSPIMASATKMMIHITMPKVMPTVLKSADRRDDSFAYLVWPLFHCGLT